MIYDVTMLLNVHLRAHEAELLASVRRFLMAWSFTDLVTMLLSVAGCYTAEGSISVWALESFYAVLIASFFML